MAPTFPGILKPTAETTAHLWPGQDTKEEARPDLQGPIDLAVYEQRVPVPVEPVAEEASADKKSRARKQASSARAAAQPAVAGEAKA